MPIAHRASSSASASVPPSGTFTITKPAGIVKNDVMVATLTDIWGEVANQWAAPAGWTLIRYDRVAATTGAAKYWKRAGGAEPASYAWTWSAVGNNEATGKIQAYSDVITTGDPVDVHGADTSGTGTSVIAPSITTTVANTMLVGSFVGTRVATTTTPPGGMTERIDVNNAAVTSETTLEGTDESFVGPGATGTRTATLAVAGGTNIGQLVALLPVVLGVVRMRTLLKVGG